MTALATTNLTTMMVRNALGETVNKVKELCTSTKINPWALYKPAYYGGNGNNSRSGVDPTNYPMAEDGYRLGDFRGYNHDALPPLVLGETSYTATGYTDADDTITQPTLLLYTGEMMPT